MLEYLRSEGCSLALAGAACSGAVQGGHVKILEYLKHNNITVVEEADTHLNSLATAFRREGGDAFNFLDSVEVREI